MRAQKRLLSAGSGKAHASRIHFFSVLGLFVCFFCFLFFFFGGGGESGGGGVSPDFHELWHSVMYICLFTEVMQQ